MSEQLLDTATRTLELARKLGAEESEVTVLDGNEFEVTVRMGNVEQLKESGSCGAGIRVLLGTRAGSAYTSDLSVDGLKRMVSSAIELARIASEDPFAGLPPDDELGIHQGELELFDEGLATLATDTKIEMAREAEKAAMAVDSRIVNSEGGSFSSYTTTRAFASSHGFAGSYVTSSATLSAAPVVEENGKLQRDYWYSSALRLDRLEPAELVGRKAGERVIRRLGARKVPTTKVPIVFEPRTARSLIGHVFEAIAGEAVYRNSSFLAGMLGEQVAASSVTIIDDSTVPGLFGSSPFDDEGVRSRRTVVVENGVLRSYLLNSYAARKLGLRTTGNASRGITGNASTGHGNLYLQAAAATPESIISSLPRGLYVTELLGSGVNIVNGDYSRGAVGLWIEGGSLAYAVEEVTIASTLRHMLEGIQEIGSDLEFRGSVAAPTILVGEMMVSGH